VQARIAAAIEAGRQAEREARHALARSHYERALYDIADGEDARAGPSLLRWVGSSYRAEGERRAALDCYIASLAAARALDQPGDVAHALNWVGIVQQDAGRLHSADRSFRKARRIALRVRDTQLVAMIEQNLGINCNIRGDLEAALRHYQRALSRYERLNEQRYTAQVLNVLGMLYTDLRRWPAAEAAFERSALLCAGLGERHTQVMVQVNRAELFVTRGQIDRAREACDRAHALARNLRLQPVLAEIFRWYGAIERESGEHQRAQRYLDQANDVASRHEMALLQGEVQRERALLFRAQGLNREALEALLHARRIFTSLQARRDLAEVARRLGELEEQFLEVVRAWAESIESKDRYTHGHCRRVAEYSTVLAAEMGFDDATLQWFRMGAYLHDVGKTEVPIEILNKPGRLTDEEFDIIKRHTTAGDEIVAGLNFPWNIRSMVRNHHENWDGSGYPDGLAGEEIPLSARVLCVVDVFDALTTTRPYRPALSVKDALEIMERAAGKQLDPTIFEAFRSLVSGGAFPALVAAA
jgi:putative nucleotidyltransferase with HDIG domain